MDDFLLHDDLELIEKYLREKRWIFADEQVQKAEKPGEGNMNYTLRVKTNTRSFILKQSRPYVEKYPQVPAPADRALQEARFYRQIAAAPDLQRYMPELLEVDEANHLLMLSDLGSGSDLTSLYQKGVELDRQSLIQLADILAQLHASFPASAIQRIENREMRALNHEHMYHYPYLADNGLDLDQVLPGLEKFAQDFKLDKPLQEKARTLGELYLSDGAHLLHGDYFPGSWLQVEGEIKLIDPEFCFHGRVEFEIGVCVAHLMLSEHAEDKIDLFVRHYEQKQQFDAALMRAFAGAEIIRRILGLAQLPLTLSLDERIELLQQARSMVLAAKL